jgi:hypothetical protein
MGAPAAIPFTTSEYNDDKDCFDTYRSKCHRLLINDALGMSGGHHHMLGDVGFDDLNERRGNLSVNHRLNL